VRDLKKVQAFNNALPQTLIKQLDFEYMRRLPNQAYVHVVEVELHGTGKGARKVR
jgi:hypothetical protein